MKVLLTALGSSGDVHPIVGIGVRLKQLGHRVVVLTNPVFSDLIDRVGLEFVPIGTAEEFHHSINNPNLWNPRKGMKIVMKEGVRPSLAAIYAAITERYVPGETVVGAHSLDFASRIAQEKIGVPVATIHLAPCVFRSVIDPPVLPPFHMPQWMPRGLVRAQFRVIDALVDRQIAEGVNAIRRQVNLPPVHRLVNAWWYSPQRVIALFPDWFGAVQSDWPQQTRNVGFPLWDERSVSEPPSELAEFLDAGDPPIIFTPGSAMAHGKKFFQVAMQASSDLGRRAILLTKHRDQIPPRLPSGMKHFDYVPFSLVLPRAAALAHHGGVGTLSQALVAGIPQLVMPMAFDQFDNAHRLRKLGVGQTLPARKFTRSRVVATLDTLLQSTEVARNCRRLSDKSQKMDGIGKACELLLELHQTSPDELETSARAST